MTDQQTRLVRGQRTLSMRANLEHLKGEAKARLKVLRRGDPGARLAAAQLAVARDYGFASWRRLKAYVDALNDVGERLVDAVGGGDAATVAAVLDQHPALVNATTDLHERIRPSDALAMRLIHLAVGEDRIEVARLLVGRGADLNVRNADGRLPLHDCFELGRDRLKDLLLGAGAAPDAGAAAAYGMFDRLEDILRLDPTQANDLTTGVSPLGWAAYGRQPAAARLLFAHGAICDVPPYDWAVWGPVTLVASTDVARVLLDHGADPSARDADGNTPLHHVIQSRIVRDPTALVECLLAAGADAAIRNAAGHTPRDEAIRQADVMAETYFPRRPKAPKQLDRVIALLA